MADSTCVACPANDTNNPAGHAVKTKGTGANLGIAAADSQGIAIGDPGVNGIAIDEGGTPKEKGGKGHATRKAFVIPHVLEKSGSINAQSGDPNASDSGTTTSADHAINTKGTGTGGITDPQPSNGVAVPKFIDITSEASPPKSSK